MKKLKNIISKTILIIFTIYLIVFSVIPETVQASNYGSGNTTAGTRIPETNEDAAAAALQNQIVEYAKLWVGVTPYVWAGSSLTKGADCSGFVMCVYKQFGYKLPHSAESLRYVGKAVPPNEVQLGDIIVTYSSGSPSGRHTGLYAGNGQWVNARGRKYGTVLNSVNVRGENVLAIRRIIGEVNGGGLTPSLYPAGKLGIGPRGQIDNKTVDLDAMDFDFAGNPQKVEYDGVTKINPWIFSKLSQIVDYILGIFTGAIRISLVGWTSIIEKGISTVIHRLSEPTNANGTTGSSGTTGENWGTGTNGTTNTNGTEEDKIYTIEDVVYNKVPILDANIFSETAGGEEIKEGSVIYIIRKIVAEWFVLVRNIMAVVLVILLVYTGIRMAISTAAEEKANYKQYLVGWLKSIILLLVMHYVFVLVLDINDSLVNVFSDVNSQENTIYETIRTRAYDTRLSIGLPGMLMYIILIFMFVKFIWVYAKRFITIIILTIISPIMIGKYSYESASGKKSRTFSDFLYLYVSNVIIQAVHALLYTSLVSIALDLALENITGFILALMFISFMLKADTIILKLFKFNNDIGDIRKPFNKKEELAGVYYGYGVYKLAKDSGKNLIKTAKRGVTNVANTVKNVGSSAAKTVINAGAAGVDALGRKLRETRGEEGTEDTENIDNMEDIENEGSTEDVIGEAGYESTEKFDGNSTAWGFENRTSTDRFENKDTARESKNVGTAGESNNKNTTERPEDKTKVGKAENEGATGKFENKTSTGESESAGTVGGPNNKNTTRRYENRDPAGKTRDEGSAGRFHAETSTENTEDNGTVENSEDRGSAGKPNGKGTTRKFEGKSTMGKPEDKAEELKDRVNKTKTKVDRYLLGKSNKYLGQESNVSQTLVLKIASRRKGSFGKRAKQTLRLRKAEKKQRYTSEFKYIASEIKGVGSVVLAVPTMVFDLDTGLALASSGIGTIRRNGRRDKSRRWTTTQKIANAVTLGHYGNRVEAHEKNEKNKRELDSLVFAVIRSNEAMEKIEEEFEQYKDPKEREQAKDVMRHVINIKAEVHRVKGFADKYMEDRSIIDISKMNDEELEHMAIEVSQDIGKESNLDEEKTQKIVDNVVKNVKKYKIQDSRKFAQIVNASAVTADVGSRFIGIAQEINKLKEAEIAIQSASKKATSEEIKKTPEFGAKRSNGNDDVNLTNINKFVDNL